MKLSYMELKRFIQAYKKYQKNSAEQKLLDLWMIHRKYFESNRLGGITNIIEDCVNIGSTLNQIIDVLESLDVLFEA